MQRSHFASYILMLTLAWMQVYASVRDVYSGVGEARARERAALVKVGELETQRDLDRDAFVEFRQNVASLMPDVLRGAGKAGYPLRALASVVSPGHPGDAIQTMLAKSTFERGKSQFNAKNFADSGATFKKVIERYGYTSYVTEAYFLLAEGLYQRGELEQCTQTIQRMIELFPQDELTGFAMVRLGAVYEERHRNEDAVDVYKTVLRTFPQRDVASQAKASLRGIDL